ncbi:MAG: Crp/Fnr family transcriptional regulator [Taibaiella sp.]|nr:Crp/Fnr family transcriptional regulator [Taibaiella sp.]
MEHTELSDGDGFLTEEDKEAIGRRIPVKEYAKGTVLLREGEVARESYFVLKGCVRCYYIIDGEERTTAFYTENESAAALSSYARQSPSTHFMQCVEDCTLSVLTHENEQALIKEFPGFAALCRSSMEVGFGRSQDELAVYITRSPEERYQHLQDTRPELLQRIPQYHLATYLGVKPESLSRIRKRLANR